MRRAALLGLILPAVLFASCQEATQVDVRVRTNVQHAPGTGIAVWASRSGRVTAPLVETADPWNADGEVGNVMVSPDTGAREGRLTVRVAMGLRGKRAADCTDDGDGVSCIIARRNLGFLPNTRLKVPVVLYLACEGVKCSPDTTCGRSGQCVPAQIEPGACATPEGCVLPGDDAVPPGPADAGTDQAAPLVEPAMETGADPVDASASTDTGTDAAAADAAVQAAVQVAPGAVHTCARLDDGTVKCWGLNSYGQLGVGDTAQRGATPGTMGATLPTVDLGPGRTAVEVATGDGHSCARLDDGTVKCWGQNTVGQLGYGDTAARGGLPGQMGANLPAVDLGPGRTARQLALGWESSCARLDNDTVKCWGNNTYGQLGLGDVASRGAFPGQLGATLPIVDLGPGRTAVLVLTSGFHSCARLDDGTVKCWGFNGDGRLGLGDSQNRGDQPGELGAALPSVDLGPGRKVVQLAAPLGNHACALLDDGTVKCWGFNNNGELGIGDAQQRGSAIGHMGALLPGLTLGPGTVRELIGGGAHTCAQFDSGAVKCWGYNFDGQLGLGDTTSRGTTLGQMGANLPFLDLGPGQTIARVYGGNYHSCACLDNGTVKCWGQNGQGQLGLGDTAARGDGSGEMGTNLPLVQLK